MTMTAEQQRSIIAKESQWVDDSFGQLDLSAFPALNELPPEQVHDNRFAKDWRDTALSSSANALRNFVTDPDSETLQRIGEETGNPEYLREVRDRKAEAVAQQFKAQCPGYLMTDDNFEMMVETLSFNALKPADQEKSIREQVEILTDAGYWTVGKLTATFRALEREGLLDVPLGTARELSTAERLRVSRLAQSGRADQAIGEYLKYALDGEEPTLDIVNDPAYSDLCADAVYYVFSQITLDYIPTAEREAYMNRHVAGRPVTLALLQSAWTSCQANEASYTRQEILNQVPREEAQPHSPGALDSLSDSEVDRLYHGSLRAYADSFHRRAPGIIA